MIANGLVTYLVHFAFARAAWRVASENGVPAVAIAAGLGVVYVVLRRRRRRGW